MTVPTAEAAATAAPETAPIGLKTEGRFELNRLSEIDALNAL